MSRSLTSGTERNMIIGIAEMGVSDDPSIQIVTYSLGSCLGIAVYDPAVRVGGMLHAMLPTYGKDLEKARATPHMFVDSGVSALFRAAYKLGAAKKRMIVKVAGGAELLDYDSFFGIGRRNYEVLVETLQRNGVGISGSAVGGNVSRTMRLDMATGSVTVSIIGQPVFEL